MSTATLHNEKKKALIPQLRFNGFEGEWEKIKLGDKIEIISGFAFKGDLFGNVGRKLVIPKNFTKIGYGNFTPKFTKFTTEECDEKLACNEGDLLVLLTDLTQSCELLGKPLLVMKEDGEVLLNQRVIKIKTNKNLEKVFLMNFLLTKNYHKYIVETSSGTTVRHSSNKIILKTKLSIPEVQEQKKIASFLSAVDEKIQQLRRKKELLSQYKKGVMQQLFSGKLRFKDENGEDYPGWDILSIEDLVNRKILAKPLDGNHGNIHPVSSDFVITGIPFIMANNIRSGKLNLEGVTCIKKEQADKLQKGFSFEDDVLLTHKGSVGLTAIVQKLETEYIMLTPQVTYYRVIDKQKLNNLFLKTVFDSSIFQKRLQTLADGGTRPYIGITMQRTLEIPFPSLSEQQKIADFLSSIDTKIESTNQQINQTQSFKKGLLNQMFV